MWSDPFCNPVDGVDGRSHRAVDAQVDCHDGLEIRINVGEVIQAWLPLDGFGVVGCNGTDVVVEARVRRTKHWATVFHRAHFQRC